MPVRIFMCGLYEQIILLCHSLVGILTLMNTGLCYHNLDFTALPYWSVKICTNSLFSGTLTLWRTVCDFCQLLEWKEIALLPYHYGLCAYNVFPCYNVVILFFLLTLCGTENVFRKAIRRILYGIPWRLRSINIMCY